MIKPGASLMLKIGQDLEFCANLIARCWRPSIAADASPLAVILKFGDESLALAYVALTTLAEVYLPPPTESEYYEIMDASLRLREAFLEWSASQWGNYAALTDGEMTLK